MMYDIDSLYGCYRTRKFCEIYPDFATFKANYNIAIPSGYMSYSLTDNELTLIYSMLLSRYGNSSIASSDEGRFMLQVSSLIFQHAPIWLKKLDIQKTLRSMSLSDLQQGTFSIHNHAYNPSAAPTTTTTTELTKIDDQNTSRWVKSPLEAYANLIALLENDVTEEFLQKFRKLFIQFVEPELPLWYFYDEEGYII